MFQKDRIYNHTVVCRLCFRNGSDRLNMHGYIDPENSVSALTVLPGFYASEALDGAQHRNSKTGCG